MTDVAFTVHPTPLGTALIVVSATGLVALQVGERDPRDALDRLALGLGSMPVPDESATASVVDELDEYFVGDRRAFDTPIDWRLVGDGFAGRALREVTRIPYGEVASYGEIAVLAGSPGAHRAVGSACARTPISIVVPAHRVVRSDGSLGEYGGHPERKRLLLELEGAPASVRG